MASGNWAPIVSADDGQCVDTVFSIDTAYLNFGQDNSSKVCHLFARFPSVNIPKDVVITAAYIRYKSAVSTSLTPIYSNLYLNAADDAVAPTSKSEFDALTLTAAITWDVSSGWVADSYYDSPSILSLVQTIVNRAGWSSGNAMMLVHKDDGSASNRIRRPDAYDASDYAPHLFVEWLVPVTATGLFDGKVRLYPARDLFDGKARFYPVRNFFDGKIQLRPARIVFDGKAKVKEHVEGSIDLPLLDVLGNTGAIGDVTLPALNVLAEVFVGVDAQGNVVLPGLEAVGFTGARCNYNLPSLGINGVSTVGIVASGEVVLPIFDVKGQAFHDAIVDGIVGLPVLRINATSIHGSLCLGEVTLPGIRVSATAKVGTICTGGVTLPCLIIEAEGGHIPTGEGNVVLPLLQVYSNASVLVDPRDGCHILRYSR